MKKIDLSEYILQKDNLLVFPLTKDEIRILRHSKDEFSTYIKIPYLAHTHNDIFLEKVINNINMDDNFWFLNTIWVCVDILAKSIVGTVKLESANENNKIIYLINEKNCVSTNKKQITDLFYAFYDANGYKNISTHNLNEVEYENM